MENGATYKTIIDDFDRESRREDSIFTKNLTQADEKIIEYLGKIIKPNMKVLEVGMGMGNVIEKLECDAWGLDASEGMLEKSSLKHKYLGNMDGMPFPDNSFDLVFMAFTLQHSLNPQKTIKESMRVLRPNGNLIIFDGDKNSSIGQEREKSIAEGNWKMVGKANWLSRDDYPHFLADHIMPHILVLNKMK